MCRQVVQQQDISCSELRQQQFIDKGIKGQMVNAAFQQQRGEDAAQPKAADQRMICSSVERHMTDDTLSAWGTAKGARQCQMKACLIGKDEFTAINSCHLLAECLSLLFISFRSRERLFFRGSPNFCRARQTVERWTET